MITAVLFGFGFVLVVCIAAIVLLYCGLLLCDLFYRLAWSDASFLTCGLFAIIILLVSVGSVYALSQLGTTVQQMTGWIQ